MDRSRRKGERSIDLMVENGAIARFSRLTG